MLGIYFNKYVKDSSSLMYKRFIQTDKKNTKMPMVKWIKNRNKQERDV